MVVESVADELLVIGFDMFNELSWGTLEPVDFESGSLWRFHLRFVKKFGAVLPGWLFFFESIVMFNVFVEMSLPGSVRVFIGVFVSYYYNFSVEM